MSIRTIRKGDSVNEISNENLSLALNLTEAAKALHVSRPTMQMIANREDFPAIRFRKRWIIPVDALDAWLKREASNGTNVAEG